jgi:hypothetical protein
MTGGAQGSWPRAVPLVNPLIFFSFFLEHAGELHAIALIKEKELQHGTIVGNYNLAFNTRST